MFSYTRTRLSDVETLEAELRSDEDGYVINFYLHTKQIGKDGLPYTTGSQHVFQFINKVNAPCKMDRFEPCSDELAMRITMMVMMIVDGPGMVTD